MCRPPSARKPRLHCWAAQPPWRPLQPSTSCAPSGCQRATCMSAPPSWTGGACFACLATTSASFLRWGSTRSPVRWCWPPPVRLPRACTPPSLSTGQVITLLPLFPCAQAGTYLGWAVELERPGVLAALSGRFAPDIEKRRRELAKRPKPPAAAAAAALPAATERGAAAAAAAGGSSAALGLGERCAAGPPGCTSSHFNGHTFRCSRWQSVKPMSLPPTPALQLTWGRGLRQPCTTPQRPR